MRWGRNSRTVFLVAFGAFFLAGLAYPLANSLGEAFYERAVRERLRDGETLQGLARRTGAEPGRLRELNRLSPQEEPARGADLVVRPGGVTLRHFLDLATSSVCREWMFNSLSLGVVVTVLTFLLSLPLSFLMARYQFRGKALLAALLLLPMIMPPFVGAIGMRKVLGRYGGLNILLMNLGLVSAASPLNFLGASRFWGVALMEVLHLYPVMQLNMTASLANVDPTLEEAAQSLGDSGWRLFRKVTLPLMMPGVFAGGAIVFIWAFTDLGTPLIFEYPKVVAKQIFDMSHAHSLNPLGHALTVAVLAVSGLVFYFGKRATKASGRGMQKGVTRREMKPLRGRRLTVVWCACGLLVFISALPHLSVVVMSVAERWFMTVLPEGVTAAHFKEAISEGIAATSIRNSVLLATASTAVDLALGLFIAHFVVRSGSRFSFLVDSLAMLPLAVPGVALAFGYLGAYGSWGFISPRVNPVPLLVFSYAVRRLPFMVRACVAGLEQMGAEQEEMSFACGAGAPRTLSRVTLPLISSNLIAGSILAFSFAMLEVSDSLILAMTDRFFPITKAIYHMFGRLVGGENVASALGVFGMLLLSASLLAAASFLGKRLGEMFRA